MTIIQAAILGIIQGVGEFLPISSSGHLVLLPWIFAWEDPGLSFDVALHFGTLLAVGLYFWKEWLSIIGAGLGISRNGQHPRKLLWILVAATIPGALAGWLLEDQAETIFRQPLLIAATLSIVGYVLYIADKRSVGTKDIKKAGLGQGLMVGFAQALAIVPGVSRSGATITTGLLTGFDRVSAAKFSFLLSAPVIFGAAIIKVDEVFANGLGTYEIVGIATAAISGYLSIAWLIKFISRVSYKVFFWYRLILAAIILILWFVRIG